MILIEIEALRFLAQVTCRDRMRFVTANPYHFVPERFYLDTAIPAAKNARRRIPLAACFNSIHKTPDFSVAIFPFEQLILRRSVRLLVGMSLKPGWKDFHHLARGLT